MYEKLDRNMKNFFNSPWSKLYVHFILQVIDVAIDVKNGLNEQPFDFMFNNNVIRVTRTKAQDNTINGTLHFASTTALFLWYDSILVIDS